jgi:hypothetical protein
MSEFDSCAFLLPDPFLFFTGFTNVGQYRSNNEQTTKEVMDGTSGPRLKPINPAPPAARCALILDPWAAFLFCCILLSGRPNIRT